MPLQNSVPRHVTLAHRGASHLAPESTEPAYRLARDMGADYLEADLQRTRDGRIIVFHDEDFARTTDMREVFPGRERGLPNEFSLAELRKLDCGSWFNDLHPKRAKDSYHDLRILTLDDLLDIADGGPGVYLELKTPDLYPGVERDVVGILKRRNWLGTREGRPRIVFQSRFYDSLCELKALAPDTPRIYIINRSMASRRGLLALYEEAVEMEALLALIGYLAWPWNIRRAHKLGLPVHVWTLNQKWQMRLAHLFGADAIFSDRCDLLRIFYAQRGLP